MVQTVKNLLKKSEEAGEDPYIALLNYRTTPVDIKLQAPAKLLNQRDYWTLLPSSGRLQRLKTNADDLLYLQRRQESQRQQLGQTHRRELEGLSSGQAVAAYNPSSKTLTTAEVKDKLDELRSYVVNTTNGSELRHNRIQLKPVAEKQTAKKKHLQKKCQFPKNQHLPNHPLRMRRQVRTSRLLMTLTPT